MTIKTVLIALCIFTVHSFCMNKPPSGSINKTKKSDPKKIFYYKETTYRVSEEQLKILCLIKAIHELEGRVEKKEDSKKNQ